MTKFVPLHDRVLVRRVSGAETSKGGIFIPESAKEKPQEGVIVAAGRGKIGEDQIVRPLDVEEGDHVLFGKYSGTDIKIDDEELVIMREEEILGVLITEREPALAAYR